MVDDIQANVAAQRAAAKKAKTEMFGVAGGGAQQVWSTPSGSVVLPVGVTPKMTKADVEAQLKQSIEQERFEQIKTDASFVKASEQSRLQSLPPSELQKIKQAQTRSPFAGQPIQARSMVAEPVRERERIQSKFRTTTATTLPGRSVRETGQLQAPFAGPKSFAGIATAAAITVPFAAASYVFGKGLSVATGRKAPQQAAYEFVFEDPFRGGVAIAAGDPKAIGSFAGGVFYSSVVPKLGDIAAPPSPKLATVEFIATAEPTARGTTRSLIELEARVGKQTKRTRIIGETVRIDATRSAGIGLAETPGLFGTKKTAIISKMVDVQPTSTPSALIDTKLTLQRGISFEKAKGFRQQLSGKYKGTEAYGFTLSKEVVPEFVISKSAMMLPEFDVAVRGVTRVLKKPSTGGTGGYVNLGRGGGGVKSVLVDTAAFLTPEVITKALPRPSAKPFIVTPSASKIITGKVTRATTKPISKVTKATTKPIVDTSNIMTGFADMGSMQGGGVRPKSIGLSGMSAVGTFRRTDVRSIVGNIRGQTRRTDVGLLSTQKSGLEQIREDETRLGNIVIGINRFDMGMDMRLGQPQKQRRGLKQPPIEITKTPLTPFVPIRPPIITTSFTGLPFADVGGFGRTRKSKRKKAPRKFRYTPTVVGLYSGRTQRSRVNVGADIIGIRYPAVASKPKRRQSLVGSLMKNRKAISKDMDYKFGKFLKF